MSALSLTLTTDGLAEAGADLQRLRNGLASRARLHVRIASAAGGLTKNYLSGLNRHKTATALGASPSGHHERTAKRIETAGDETAGYVRIPRTSGLQRAFSSYVIRPKNGKKFLTIPAHKRTYGKRVGEFPEGTFRFAMFNGRFPALMFAGGFSTEVAYWLRRSVKATQDRTLLPSDAAYLEIAGRETRDYITEILGGAAT